MVLVFAETENGIVKKSSLEAISYGFKTAKLLETDCVALTIGSVENTVPFGEAGASKVFNIPYEGDFDSQVFTQLIAQVIVQTQASVVVMSHNSTGKALLGRLAVKLKAGSVSAVNALPEIQEGFRVSKQVFSGKALTTVEIVTPIKVLSIQPNSFGLIETDKTATLETLAIEVPSSKVTVIERKTTSDSVPLPEADIVVSAGRGMKDPENWGIIEELATVLGATTACSRPVADAGWRPHHEHVGQTGIAIRPSLYIAVGISGAIQHLAGVNNSKVIVVINKDPDAPFFSAADYGICGDLFEVVPKLTEAIKQL